MLPAPNPSHSLHRSKSHSWVPEYIRRIFHYPQMDIDYTFWQMFYLCVSPTRVYRTTAYRKQTKNQWARDDPAFVAIMIIFMGIASFSYAIAFHSESFLHMFRIILWTICFDFLFVGCLIATLGWIVANKFLIDSQKVELIYSVEHRVEWLYSFDVHCNSFFPVFLILYVTQYFFVPLLLSSSFIATFITNTIYSLSFAYYFHITFLGYDALPFLHNTYLFLYPIGLIILFFVISLLFNFNYFLFVMNLYFA